MYKKIFKKKILLNLFKSINLIKKKKILTLGPIGNYSYNVLYKKINKKHKTKSIINISSLIINDIKIIPYENNNGGLVKDCIELLFKKKTFINSIFILNIKHNFFIYKRKKIFFLHNQSYKQIKNTIKFCFKKIKINFTNSNSNINNGFNICNSISLKTFPINIKKINLKNNYINKTKFIINKINKKKKNFLSFFCENIFFLKNILMLYKKNNIFYFEIFIKSYRNFLYLMKIIKNKTKILISGFFNIL